MVEVPAAPVAIAEAPILAIPVRKGPVPVPRYDDMPADLQQEIDDALGGMSLDVMIAKEDARQTGEQFETESRHRASVVKVHKDNVQDALGDASTKNVSSTGGQYSLLSFFGKADYNFADKYVASFTVRRDGSSRLGPQNRWGTFPAALSMSSESAGMARLIRRPFSSRVRR